jgi:hypothetical protein
MRLFFTALFILALALPETAASAGIAAISGVTQDGVHMSIDFDNSPVKVVVWKMDKTKPYPKPYAEQTFPNEPCELRESYPPQFSCGSSGKSPLAGTKYVVKVVNRRKLVKSICGDLAPESHYVCVSGCNAHIPRFMDQDPWEC